MEDLAVLANVAHASAGDVLVIDAGLLVATFKAQGLKQGDGGFGVLGDELGVKACDGHGKILL